MKNVLKTTILFLTVLAITSCATTAMYTSPSIIDPQRQIYNFSIETGGYAGQAEADERVAAEIKPFMYKNNYHHFKILNRMPLEGFSGFKYAVQFYN